MTPEILQTYLYQKIPQAASMQVEVVEIEVDSLTLSAPLAPNINHRDSVFGGSASSVAILAAWSYLHQKIQAENISTTLVIQKNDMTYDVPITGTFQARAFVPVSGSWERFIRMLKNKNKARIQVTSELEFKGVIAGQLNGVFVAVGNRPIS